MNETKNGAWHRWILLHRSLLAPAAFLVAAGCGPDAASTSRLPMLTELPTIPVVEELRIGSLDDPAVGFTRIGDVWESPAGELYVVERSVPELRVYDAEGALVRTYGRQGEGPGEFQMMSDFGVLGDTVWIADARRRRLTMFAREGDVLATVSASIRIPIGESMGIGRSVTVYPGELRPGGVIVGNAGGGLHPGLRDSVVQVPRVRFDLEGKIVDTLELVPRLVGFSAREISAGGRIHIVRVDPPAPDSGSYRVSSAGDTTLVRWSVTDGSPAGRISVTRATVDGDTVARSVFAYEPRPVQPAEIDSMAVERAWTDGLSRGDSLEIVQAHRDAIQVPPHHPPIGFPRSGDDGSVWIPLEEADARANRWIVVAPDGTVSGIVDLAENERPVHIRENHAWVTATNEVDVPWLVRYRIDAG